MTEVCLLLIKGNMGGTRPTAPKARRSRQQSGLGCEVGEGEGSKSLSCFRLSLPLDPVAVSPNLQAADSAILPRDRGSARNATALRWPVIKSPALITVCLPECMLQSPKALLTDNHC